MWNNQVFILAIVPNGIYILVPLEGKENVSGVQMTSPARVNFSLTGNYIPHAVAGYL